MSKKVCTQCNANLPLFAATCNEKRGGCGKRFCKKCLRFALVTKDEADKNGAYGSKIDTFCKSCFQKHSNLDYETPGNAIKVYEGDGKHSTLLFVHGGGGCRLMFDPHAKRLMSMGYRCVLLDLPGHGTQMDVPLTMESAIEYIVQCTKKYCPGEQRPVYVGGSLGGYIGMELLGKYPELFQAAIITMCGQHVGPGASLIARLSLKVMRSVIPKLQPATLLNGMRGETKKSGHISDELLLDTFLRPGSFFMQGKEQVKILQNSMPSETLPKYERPILFINGSRDHRDSENLWVEKSSKGKLIVYDGADHFFSHDDRFMDRFLDDVVQFVDEHAPARKE